MEQYLKDVDQKVTSSLKLHGITTRQPSRPDRTLLHDEKVYKHEISVALLLTCPTSAAYRP